MSPFALTELERFRRDLERTRGDLVRALAGSRDAVRPVDLGEPIGRISRVDAIQQQKMAEATRRAAENRLRRVESALRRLAGGEYGLCLQCEEEIDAARLRVQPEATLCLECQSEREQRSRGDGKR